MELIRFDSTASEANARQGSHPMRRVAVPLASLIVVGLVVITAGLGRTTGASTARVAAGSAGLSAQQIVIRGEVQDRMSGSERSGSAGLSAQQIVIRGEVQDRMSGR